MRAMVDGEARATGAPALGVLLSGRGTNLQALLGANAARTPPPRVALVVSNKADAHGLTRARERGIATVVLAPADYPSREACDARVVEVLRAHGVALVVLAGFMRLVTRVLLDAFPDGVLNVHPALLPAFPG